LTNPNFQAFTIRANARALRIETNVGISRPRTAEEVAAGPEHNGKAVWDTGATGSVIHPRIAKDLELIESGKKKIQGVNSEYLTSLYMVDIYLPNMVCVQGVQVSVFGSQSMNFDMLIGMDLISMGDFAFTNLGGKSVFSFRTPSMAQIDYVEDHRKLKKPAQVPVRIGRNEPCHCGSGRKYKHCHGRNK